MSRLIPALALGLLISVGVAVAQTAGRPMTVDDILDAPAVGGAQVSPDGKWIVFSKSDLDWKENKRHSYLWMVSTEGGRPFQFTGNDGDASPWWSPDGKTIAFLRGKNGGDAAAGAEAEGRQIWTISLMGGEATKLTDHKDGITAFHWSADGKQAFFVANDPKSDADKKVLKSGEDAIFVDEGPNGQGRGEWEGLWVFDLAAKKERRITKDQMIFGSFDPSPDGKQIAFCGRKENARNDINLSEIYLADVATGDLTRLTNNEAPESEVRWSPDGKTIAYLAPHDKSWELANEKIWTFDVATRKYKKVSGDFDGGIDYYQWSADGRHMVFNAQQRTARNLYELDVENGTSRKLTDSPGVLIVGSVSSDGKKAAAIYSTPQQPGEVGVVDVDKKAFSQLSDFNSWIKDVALAKSEIVKWKSKDGLEIEGILYLPSDYKQGNRIPLILTIHGGPAGSFSYGYSGIYHVYTGLGFAVLCPNVRGSSSYSDALIRGAMHDLGGGDYQDLMTGVDSIIARGIADPNKLGLRGWSYGGILGGWTITQTNRFKAASLGAMVADWKSEYGTAFGFDVRLWYIGGSPWDNPEGYVKESAYSYIKNVTTPTLLLHGEQDNIDPIGESMSFYQALKERGVKARFIRFPREPHGFREPHHQRTRDVEEIAWMEKYINGVDWKCPRPGDKSDQKEADKDAGK
jgi:dipeptidyl aminopeptidase/acylaminoacyl peptidase